MPSFDGFSDPVYDAASEIPISEMNADECDAEKLRIRDRMDLIEALIAANFEAGMDPNCDATIALKQRHANLRLRFHEVNIQMDILDEQDRTMAAENRRKRSPSWGRSSQSPPAPRAPHPSPQR
ncbi:uncharacterized protein EAF01_005555 [Botrytis porri]|uniref:REM-1 domain-containing protein n=1 Tax=Botrytis porri TaxID=87229 RepID=A0A4Z1KX87_9HELO|nr:uncharacterized protein EAF01_005555 [Botrytis porri]KAF7905034.1 hypothetical protein EAF01_005555 [Botrytis porri]TGO89060.1 hypothetical protein BPOR_0127g00160 [Botrytis porri]